MSLCRVPSRQNDPIDDRLQNIKKCKNSVCGHKPTSGSYRRGVPFSNNKMFWYLLNRAGLLHEAESDLKNDQLLKKIYDKKFLRKWELNFVTLVDRPKIDVTDPKKGEERPGVKRALRIIQTHSPKVVCFIGKIAFNTFYNSYAIGGGSRKLAPQESISLSDAFSNPWRGGDPRERVNRSETSWWRVILTQLEIVRAAAFIN